jgi:hypothetical protein
MENTAVISIQKERQKIVILDLMALAIIYLIPSVSHLLSFPLYLAEPLRVMVILSLIHTRKENAFILAVTLPLFSFLISGHPIMLKMLIIIFELGLNAFLFLILTKKMNIFLSMLMSIALSKVFFYAIQYLFISATWIDPAMVEHPIVPQIVVTVVLSGYGWLMMKKKN